MSLIVEYYICIKVLYILYIQIIQNRVWRHTLTLDIIYYFPRSSFQNMKHCINFEIVQINTSTYDSPIHD